MLLINLVLVFGLIVTVLAFRKPLYLALTLGILATILLYQLSLSQVWEATHKFLTNHDSLVILLSMYLITFLQKMLESRDQIKLAEGDLSRLFQNRRVTISGASLVIGLLPSAAAMVLCADIVKNQTDGYLEKDEQAFVTSWFRHIPESSLPTYPSVLLMASLSDVAISKFMAFMVIPFMTLYAIGYVCYLRWVPKEPSGKMAERHWQSDLVQLIQHLWSLLLIIFLILAFKVEVVPAVLISIALAAVVYRFSLKELIGFFLASFEMKLLASMAFVLYFKEFLNLTGALASLPDALSGLPLPTFLIFVFLFFLGGIISGASGIIALGTPLAFAAVPDGGVALLVLLMCCAHAASQLSPVHVCLTVVSEYYSISLGDLMKKTLPASFFFLAVMIVYYLFLTLVV